MAAYNSESTLVRMLGPHYARAEDEARALLREAMTLSGDLRIVGDTLHVTLDPASAPRRSRALHALCQQLTATQTIYPDTQLKIVYSVKGQNCPSRSIPPCQEFWAPATCSISRSLKLQISVPRTVWSSGRHTTT
jgi:transposase-like protein